MAEEKENQESATAVSEEINNLKQEVIELRSQLVRDVASRSSSDFTRTVGGDEWIPGSGMVVPMGPRFCFGLGWSGTTVTVYPGYIQQGTRSFVLTVETNIEINNDHEYIPLEYPFGGASATIGAATVDIDICKPDTTTWRGWLYKFRLIEGIISLDNPGIGLGGRYVYLPGNYA